MLEAAFARLVEQWEGLFLAAGRRLPGGRAAGLGQGRARSPAVCDRRRARRARRRSRACGRASPCGAAWPRQRSPPSRSTRRALHQSAGRRCRRPGWSPRSRPTAATCSYLAVYDARDWRGGAVARLRRTRRRPGLRAVDDRGPERAGLDGRHPGRRRPRDLPVKPEIKAKLDKGVALAISLEPAGGSPNGQPTDRRGCRRPPEHLASIISRSAAPAWLLVIWFNELFCDKTSRYGYV